MVCAQNAQQRDVSGIVLLLDKAHHTMSVSCDEIPGYMEPMKMSFGVTDWRELRTIHTGDPIHFKMTQQGSRLSASVIHAGIAANLESEPMQAGSLSALQAAMEPRGASQALLQGQHVADFILTDQADNAVRLSSLEGKGVLLTFGYSRCPNPEYCLRLSNNLARAREHLAPQQRRDLVLITVAIDPEHDQGPALKQYAAVWKANPTYWHFVTGPLPAIKAVAAQFGMNFWPSEGLLTHSLHTVVIDRSGNLAANLEGNRFSSQQLADLVQTVIDTPSHGH
jgi:protein SCO1/2